MNAVWLIVMFSYGGYLNFGPEFKSAESCEAAAQAIKQSANEHRGMLNFNKHGIWCVRIER
jgi:hypothetical protein